MKYSVLLVALFGAFNINQLSAVKLRTGDELPDRFVECAYRAIQSLYNANYCDAEVLFAIANGSFSIDANVKELVRQCHANPNFISEQKAKDKRDAEIRDKELLTQHGPNSREYREYRKSVECDKLITRAIYGERGKWGRIESIARLQCNTSLAQYWQNGELNPEFAKVVRATLFMGRMRFCDQDQLKIQSPFAGIFRK